MMLVSQTPTRLALIMLLNMCAVSMLSGQTATGKAVLYAAVGPELTQYDIDMDHAALIKRGSVTLPANVQEAWQHPSKKFLYVAWSNGGARKASCGGRPPSGDHP